MSVSVGHDIAIPAAALAELCQRYQVRELALFGSVLRDDFRADSDIDVLVEFEPDARFGLFTYFALRDELEVLLGRTVDLVEKPGLKRAIRDEVLRAAQVIYGG